MRLLTSAIIVAGTLLAVAPASAQTYDPRYPVCMYVYGGGRGGGYWIDCSYASIPQCAASASGRSAQCMVNPYYAYATPTQPYRPRGYRRPY